MPRSKRYGNIHFSTSISDTKKDYFDHGSGRWLSVSDIKNIEKTQGKTFGSDSELDRECEKNKRYNEDRLSREISKELDNKLSGVLS